jgi:hypothetical protein
MLVKDKTFCASSKEDKQPTVQALTAYHARLLAGLADALLESKAPNVYAGLLVIRDELLALATAIRKLEPEESDITTVVAELDRRRSPAETKEEYTLEKIMTELDRRWPQSRRC